MASGIDLMGGAISVRDGRSLNVGGIATSLGQITTHACLPLHLPLYICFQSHPSVSTSERHSSSLGGRWAATSRAFLSRQRGKSHSYAHPMGKKTDTLATTGKKAEASAVSWQGAKAVKGASSSAGSPSSPTTVISASAPANPALLQAFLKQQEADFRAMAPPELSEALSSCQSELEAAWLVKTHLYNLDPVAVPLFMRFALAL